MVTPPTCADGADRGRFHGLSPPWALRAPALAAGAPGRELAGLVSAGAFMEQPDERRPHPLPLAGRSVYQSLVGDPWLGR